MGFLCIKAHVQAQHNWWPIFSFPLLGKLKHTNFCKRTSYVQLSKPDSKLISTINKEITRQKYYLLAIDVSLPTNPNFGKNLHLTVFYIKCFKATDGSGWGIPALFYYWESVGHWVTTDQSRVTKTLLSMEWRFSLMFTGLNPRSNT